MTAQPPWATPIPWDNQDITLYHGTLLQSADSIVKNGVSLQYAREGRDFGRGFYTTTLRRQAVSWTYRIAAISTIPGTPALVEFTVSRDVLVQLDCLWFIRGEADAEEFWSFIFHCRSGIPGHGRSVNGGWYDMVVGRVTSSWQRRELVSDYDQVSFHTDEAISGLNSATRRIVNLSLSSRGNTQQSRRRLRLD